MDDSQSTISHLRLIVGREIKETAALPKVIIPVAEYDKRIKEPWARIIAASYCEKLNHMEAALFTRRRNCKFEMLCAIEKFLGQHKTAPTDAEWACFIAKHNATYCRNVILMVGQYLPRLMPSRFAWNESIYLRRSKRYIAEKKGTWKEPILEHFAKNLNRRQENFQEHGWTGADERFTSKTKARAIKSVVIFLDFLEDKLGLNAVGGLTQNGIDKYMGVARFDVPSLRRLIYLLQRKGMVSQDLRIPNAVWDADIRKLLIPREISAFTDELMALADTNVIQEVLIALFVLHYGQAASKVCAMRIESLGWTEDESLTIRFANVDLTLHPSIAEKLKVWLAQRTVILEERGDLDNPYIFIDRRFMLPLSCEHIAGMLPIKGIDFTLWRTSAILNAYRNGVRNAKVLVDAFGISMPTALKYQRVFGETIRANVSVQR